MKFEFLGARLARLEITALEVYFAEFMAELSDTFQAPVVNLFANLALAEANQHTCLEVTDPELATQLKSLETVTYLPADLPAEKTSACLPNTPLVLWGNKFYLQRYYGYEMQIAESLAAFNQPMPWQKNTLTLLNQLFDSSGNNAAETDSKIFNWQKVAAFNCLSRQLSIITGGPGTGKTSTIVKILAILLADTPDIRIKLAAPTGKAAMRLSESIAAAKQSLPEAASVPSTVSTLHRLLGMRSDGRSVKYHSKNLLNLDLLILDECSMVDLIMFHRLLSALPKHCRIILVGDPDQLPSVETGAVFRDLCQLGISYDPSHLRQLTKLWPDLEQQSSQPHRLQNVITRLIHSYRFQNDIGIGSLSQKIRDQKAISTDEFGTNDESKEQVVFHSGFSEESLIKHLLEQYQNYLEALKTSTDPANLLLLFDQFRALAPTKLGPFGINHLNQRLDQKINPNGKLFYHGKPLMIQRNDYNLGLFNGDVGICIQQSNGDFLIAFPNLSGNEIEENNEVRYFLPGRLPDWEPCFVMTVHKSQGSEFDIVSLILDPDTIESVNNQLIYTGVTRAKKQVHIFSTPEALNNIISQTMIRNTGLADRFDTLP